MKEDLYTNVESIQNQTKILQLKLCDVLNGIRSSSHNTVFLSFLTTQKFPFALKYLVQKYLKITQSYVHSLLPLSGIRMFILHRAM